jgi:hypothetical protein
MSKLKTVNQIVQEEEAAVVVAHMIMQTIMVINLTSGEEAPVEVEEDIKTATNMATTKKPTMQLSTTATKRTSPEGNTITQTEKFLIIAEAVVENEGLVVVEVEAVAADTKAPTIGKSLDLQDMRI